jgi:hypothetical protein
MIKCQLEWVEAAPLIPAIERTRAARAAKSKQPKGERVRKQRPLAIAPQQVQPVSAHLRSAKHKSVIDSKKQGDEDDSQCARLDNRLKDNETALLCLPLCVFPDEKRKYMDEPKEVCVYIKLKITQLPAPTNEPKERMSEIFSNHSLESEADFFTTILLAGSLNRSLLLTTLMILTTFHRLSTRMLAFIPTILLAGSLKGSLILTILMIITTFHSLSTRMIINMRVWIIV